MNANFVEVDQIIEYFSCVLPPGLFLDILNGELFESTLDFDVLVVAVKRATPNKRVLVGTYTM